MSELSEKCQTSVSSSGSSSKSLGVQKFCSKLRHKIEDNLNSARLTNKLRKSSRHSMSMSALSGIADATTGKYTNKSGKLSKEAHNKTTKQVQVPAIQQKSGMLKHKRVVAKSTQHLLAEETLQPEGSVMTAHKEISADSFTSTYVDSDDEYQLPSMSWTKQSLEDEIFEELEKAAHDENKLNSVLKSFDRILTDFHDEIDANNLHVSNKKVENDVNALLEKAEKQHVADNKNVTSTNLDKNISAPTTIKSVIITEKNVSSNKMKAATFDNEPKKTVMKLATKTETNKILSNNSNLTNDKKVAPVKLAKSRTTLCENLPKKLSPTSKLNKSVMDVATPTIMPVASKIPIWKALPLSKRSKSFCYAPPVETKPKPISVNAINMSMRNRAISYTTLPRHKLQQQQQRQPLKITDGRNKLIKSKTELNVKTKPQQYRNTYKSIPTLPQLQSQPPGNLRRSHTNSDELLDKCMEKGQQILRKIETLGEEGARLKIVTQNAVKKSMTTTAEGIENSKKKCSIISNKSKPIETQQQSAELKAKDPKYLVDKGRQYSDALSDDSGHISNEADPHATGGLDESSTSTLGSLCDFENDVTNSSLIINDNINNVATTTTTTTPRSTKITELLQKFENTTVAAAATTTTTSTTAAINKKSNTAAKLNSIKTTTTTMNTNINNKQLAQRICTSLKVTEVEPVPCIQTHIEIFPNYSKEVTTWFY